MIGKLLFLETVSKDINLSNISIGENFSDIKTSRFDIK